MNANNTNPNILMIINEFPPTGESGVQRPLKFLKYLSKFGWQTYVITPKIPPKNVLDESLINDIPADTMIFKTHSLGLQGKGLDQVAELRLGTEKSQKSVFQHMWKVLKLMNDFLFPIDKQIGWIPFAFHRAVHVIRKYKISNVYITAYPFSSFLVGIMLKKFFHSRIQWVADYRDAWQFQPQTPESVHRFRLKIIKYWDKKVMQNADHLVFTNDNIRMKYVSLYPWIENKSTTITNGYDDDDFKDLSPYAYDRFTFLFMGKTYILSGDPVPLLNAISHTELNDYQYVQIGNCPKEILEGIRHRKLDFYHFWDYKPHREALNYAAGADINVIMFSNIEESKTMLPGGKFFELLRIGRPILAVGPRSSLISDYMEKHRAGKYACIDDEKEIIACINELKNNREYYTCQKPGISDFSRESLTKQLESLLIQ